MDVQKEKIKLLMIMENTYVRKAWELFLNDSQDFQIIYSAQEFNRNRDNDFFKMAQIALLDLSILNYIGIETVKIITKQFPMLHVFIYGITDNDKSVLEAILAGAIGFISKSSHPNESINCFYQAMEEISPISPVIARNIIKYHRESLTPKLLDKDELRLLMSISSGNSISKVGEIFQIEVYEIGKRIRNIYRALQQHSSKKNANA